MLIRIIILQFLLFIINLNAITIEDNHIGKTSVLEHSSYFIDKSSKLTIDQIKSKNFQKSNRDYFKLSYTKDSLWVKFKITNNTNKDLKKYLVLSNPLLDHISLYTSTESKTVEKKAGKYYKKEENLVDLAKPTFEINLKSKETKEFYLKTTTISSANYYQLFLVDSLNLHKDEFNYQLIETLFFGAMIALIIYNIFIFIFTKETPYLYYVLYIFFITLNHASYSGMLSLVLGNEYYRFDINMNLYYISLATIFALLFIKSFINSSKEKILNIISNSLIGTILIILVLNNSENYLMHILSLLVTITTLFILYLTIYSYYKKVPEVKYILVGWLVNIAGILVISSKQHGIETPFDKLDYFYEFATFLEAILFSIALISKLNKTKELENSLETNKILMNELNHRVKNNMQFIILLYRLKLSKLIDKNIDEKLIETESAVQAMSKLHESIYNSKHLEKISTKTYFEELIEKTKDSFNITQNINVNINTNIDITKSIYCGIILNELLTNAVKYAFKDSSGEINISLVKNDNMNILEISDNGIGFDYNEKRNGDSFGLTLIEALVEDELKGKIKYFNKNGTKIVIEF